LAKQPRQKEDAAESQRRLGAEDLALPEPVDEAPNARDPQEDGDEEEVAVALHFE
jgi:hypothetical protein